MTSARSARRGAACGVGLRLSAGQTDRSRVDRAALGWCGFGWPAQNYARV